MKATIVRRALAGIVILGAGAIFTTSGTAHASSATKAAKATPATAAATTTPPDIGPTSTGTAVDCVQDFANYYLGTGKLGINIESAALPALPVTGVYGPQTFAYVQLIQGYEAAVGSGDATADAPITDPGIVTPALEAFMTYVLAANNSTLYTVCKPYIP